jgi:hypothetical protein
VILIELLLPLWHRDTKKGKYRCYAPRSLLIGFLIFLGVLILFPVLGLHIILIHVVHRILATRIRRSVHILKISPIDQAISIPSCLGQSFSGTFGRSRRRRVLVENVKIIHN